MSHIEGVIPWIGRRTIDKNASYDFKVMVWERESAWMSQWERESAWMSQWERERVGSDIGVPFPLQQRVIFSSGATWTSVPRLKADSILCVSYRGRIVRGREWRLGECVRWQCREYGFLSTMEQRKAVSGFVPCCLLLALAVSAEVSTLLPNTLSLYKAVFVAEHIMSSKPGHWSVPCWV